METLWLFFALVTKHFIVDYPLQKPYQYLNKGKYGHPGGVLHSWLHGVGTFVCLYWYAPIAAIYLALFDFFVHYHIDWAKTNLNNKMGWGANTHQQFWWLLGLDQYLHYVTYILIVYMVTQ